MKREFIRDQRSGVGTLDLFTCHVYENNPKSEDHLRQNFIHFSAQCLKVYNILISGGMLTVYGALTEEGISSLPRRILDLKQKGFKVSDRWDDRTTVKTKIWFMTSSDIKHNQTQVYEKINGNNSTPSQIEGLEKLGGEERET